MEWTRCDRSRDQGPGEASTGAGGPMTQPVDPEAASDEMAQSPDAAYGQREGQADPEFGSQ